MQYICLETILALDIMHNIFQWNERAKSQLETLKFFSFTLLKLGFTTTKAKAHDELHNDVRTNCSLNYDQNKDDWIRNLLFLKHLNCMIPTHTTIRSTTTN